MCACLQPRVQGLAACGACHAFPPVQLCSRRDQCAATAAPVRPGVNSQDDSRWCNGCRQLVALLSSFHVDDGGGLVRLGAVLCVVLLVDGGPAPLLKLQGGVIAALKWPSRGVANATLGPTLTHTILPCWTHTRVAQHPLITGRLT